MSAERLPDPAAAGRWEFWIDVGGTFTDCFARTPEGQLRRAKLLSSGATKGQARVVDARTLLDARRRGEPNDFWRGYELTQLAADGSVQQKTTVVASESASGQLHLAQPLAVDTPTVDYELTSDEEAPVLAVRRFLGLQRDASIPAVRMRLGTTRGTNALLTRRGARVGWLTTRGLGDILEIGYQDRPRLFDLCIRKTPTLYAAVGEVNERIAADGTILTPLDEEDARRQLGLFREQGIESVAICLMNAYVNDMHERQLAGLARVGGFKEVSVSSELAPLIKLVARGDTTTLNAYLNPVLQTYLQRIRTALGSQSELHVLTSAGGLVDADRFQGKDSILSGPAGGVVGFSRAAQQAGFPRALGFDMGGTSTDVSRFDGQFQKQYETIKAGVRVVAPTLAIETVAAGGGSLCSFDGVKLVVGPDSAGASPGPACYGRGGPLTVTDLNVYLGRLATQHFPFPLNRDAVERRLTALGDEVQRGTVHAYTAEQLAAGLLTIANANMARAVRSISIAQGYHPQDYVLVAFGGAAPQHACAVAEQLDMTQVLLHPDASLLSAYGIGTADVVRHEATGIYEPWDEVRDRLREVFEPLAAAASAAVAAEGIPSSETELRYLLDMRFEGQDAYLTIEGAIDQDWSAVFLERHRQMFGFVLTARRVEAVAARVEATGHVVALQAPPPRGQRRDLPQTREYQRVFLTDNWQDVPLHRRENLTSGHTGVGPLLIADDYSTAVVLPGWNVEVLPAGEVLLTRTATSGRQVVEPLPRDIGAASDVADPIALEVFHHAFGAIAEQMGITLRSTSCSVNVKERLDFSCAVFTSAGDLVANAPHIPVHLGAMSETVKSVIRTYPAMTPGDVYVTNDPYSGGSHLPDVTVVTPVFLGSSAGSTAAQPDFFTASRAHHAEIGGIVPGSMPPQSRTLSEEGVLLQNVALVRGGHEHWDELRRLLSDGPYPSRSVELNLADIMAQVAANQQGARDLASLCRRCGLATTHAYTRHIQNAAERKMRAALGRLPSGRYEFTDYLDDGSPIRVAITIADEEATLDFTGTGPVLPGNLNANRAIVTAAVMYCLRCLLAEDIPLNQGVLAPIQLVLPPCLLNPPWRGSASASAAVAGGNVETSQRVVDVILGALGAAAASQGTMNNFSFGNAQFGYYETVCGGAGATPQCAGASAVHTHMTNTRLTDPEVFEQRFPARVRQFSIRRGSGGEGRFPGGDGVVRSIEFLVPLQVSIVAQRRGPYAPFGLAGGRSGTLGANELRHNDGTTELLPGIVQCSVQPGDVLTIRTPGGGGYGEVPPSSSDAARRKRQGAEIKTGYSP